MQDKECIVFERTRDTDQRIHEPWACLWVPCSSRLQPIVGWIISTLRDICSICLLEFFMHVAKKNSNAVKSSVSLKQNQFGRLHWRTVNFVSFKKWPNISLYVEHSQTLIWFFEDFKFAYKTTKFCAKWLVRNFGQKHELQYLEKFAAWSWRLKFFMR